ncbi:hypothetical protein L1887_22034 [Cichorium endivia]|nr:hypothetical protein L1887_22034 [Cichorium endivia]
MDPSSGLSGSLSGCFSTASSLDRASHSIAHSLDLASFLLDEGDERIPSRFLKNNPFYSPARRCCVGLATRRYMLLKRSPLNIREFLFLIPISRCLSVTYVRSMDCRGRQVTSPCGNILHHKQNATHGQFAFSTNEVGQYLVCFWANDPNQGGALSVNIDWKTGIVAEDWESVASREKIEGVELELRELEGAVEQQSLTFVRHLYHCPNFGFSFHRVVFGWLLFPDGVGNIQIDCGSDIDSSSVGIRKNWLKLKQNWTCVYDANSQANGKNKPNGKFVRLHCFEVPVCLCGGGGRDSSMKESHGRSIFMQALHSQCATILMAAGDMFRAAASDQLGIWVERTGCEIVLAEKEKAKAPSM